MDYKSSLDSKRSSISGASLISGDSRRTSIAAESRRSSVSSDLSFKSFSDRPIEQRVTLLDLQNKKTQLRFHNKLTKLTTKLEKLTKSGEAAPKQSEYMLINPDPIAKKIVCDGKNFRFSDFKESEDVTTLKDLASDASSRTDPFFTRHQNRLILFKRNYNCVFQDAEGRPSLGYRIVKSEHKHRHGPR